jgi:predicted Zn-dependent peptidase
MPGLRTLALTVAVRGGAKWETEATSGWSHCLEHLVFKGAGDMGAREIVERIEAEGGSLNASTGYERTSFEVRALHGSLPLAMQVVSDLVFRPTLDPAEIEREKDVVAQEIAEAFDTPDDHVFEMAQTRAFEGQPLGRPILGSVASLKPVTRAAIGDWRARLYSPDRMVVAVSGRAPVHRRRSSPDPADRTGQHRLPAARALGSRSVLCRDPADERDPRRRHGLASVPERPRGARPRLCH